MSDSCNINGVLPTGFAPSTFLNSNIQTYGDLAYYVKTLLGYPVAPVEISDEIFRIIIDEAFEHFSKFTKGEEKYLIFCGDKYIPNCGIKLDELINPCLDCISTCESYEVTSTTCSAQLLKTEIGFLDIQPITISLTSHFDDSLMESPLISGYEYNQRLVLSYDPKKPWSSKEICDADCLIFRPKNSNWYNLSTNGYLLTSYINFNSTTTAFSAIPTNQYINIPTSALPLSAFYPPKQYLTWPLQTVINIASGKGFIKPGLDITEYTDCQPASSYWRICDELSIRFLDCDYTDYKYLDSCKHPLSTIDLTAPYLSAKSGKIFKNPKVNVEVDLNLDGMDDIALAQVCYLSASDGSVFAPSALDISKYTHFELVNFPFCVGDNIIPIDSSNGFAATFSLCNSGLDTFGDMEIPCVRFLNDCTIPSEILYQDICGWDSGGFRMIKDFKNLSPCSRRNFKCSQAVDIDLYKTVCADNYGTLTYTTSGNYDPDKFSQQKIANVFSANFARNGLGGYGFGDNILFSFDYALAQSLFGQSQLFGMNFANNAGLVDWYMAKSYVEQVQKMLRHVTYNFNPKTQMLQITPEPNSNSCGGSCGAYCYIIGVYLEPTASSMINEPFVKDWVYGRALQILGKIRGRYGSVSLVGGAVINGDAATQEGDKIIERALNDIREWRYDVPQTIWTF